jgi:D-arabinose 1-dehydrogenase-like Zn-dependent alcohol dehydrogenase
VTETVPARWLCSVEPPLWPDGEPLWRLAALADAALAPYTALARAGVGPSDTVIVVGSDARAHFGAAIAAAKGASVTVDDGTLERRAGAVILATRADRAERQRALALAGDGATVVLLDGADHDGDFVTDWRRLVAAEIRVLGVVGGHPDLLPELCALVVRGQLPLGENVRPVALADAARAHADYAALGGTLPIAVPEVTPNG